MSFLDKTLRRKLESAVIKAHNIAEQASRNALSSLGVGSAEAPSHFEEKDKNLRKKLRAHGRQLGDRKLSDGTQEINKLAIEIAYEHWHRMLFSRFLEANNLLMHPDGVPVTLSECEELARESGISSKWIIAESYASKMLPQIFRIDSPALLVKLHPADRKQLEEIIEELPEETFTSDDSLGWVYQYWQSEMKEAVNRSEKKIGAEELPAVTQLFTEDYMVEFLLHNSLGAWWIVNYPHTQCPVELKYLKNKDDGTPVVQTVAKWPKNLSEFRLLDPCCGSGHFVTAAFRILFEMRRQLEETDIAITAENVLRDNIYGLEIDGRCVEIAVFALALEAWKRGGYRELPKINVACCGKAPEVPVSEWVELAEGEKRIENGLKNLYDHFSKAPLIGSLIDPTRDNYDVFTAGYEEIGPVLLKALQKENDESKELAIAAQGISDANKILSEKYHLVITNVPYLSRGKQSDALKEYCESYSPEGKNDLANVFLDRCLMLCEKEKGMTQIVMPQNWLFLKSYQKQREKLLKSCSWDLLARLGAGAFQTPMWNFNVQLLTISRCLPYDRFTMYGIDVSEQNTTEYKASLLLSEKKIMQILQNKHIPNSEAIITFNHFEGVLLGKYCDSYQGIKTGDDNAKKRFHWELPFNMRWLPFSSTVQNTTYYGGLEAIIDWQFKGEDMARLQGIGGWNKKGVSISQMGQLPVSLFNGTIFDSNVSPLIVHESDNIAAIWCFCSSKEFNKIVRQIDQKLNVANATLVKVPFDLDYWKRLANEKYPNGLPKPFSNDPTQWIFHGHPQPSESPLQVAVAKLLGYMWPAETDKEMELSDEAHHWIEASKKISVFADADGIVCIPSVRGEQGAADRLFSLLEAAFGKELDVNALISSTGTSSQNIEQWLRNDFFEQHCSLFQHRPFIWQIWDGLRDGFSALVNYHSLTKQKLETLIYTYLADWISRQKAETEQGVSGAQSRLAAAQDLKRRLELILEGEAPYDIFVRWKPLEQQPLGWDPDINDGVRLNIRPFMTAQVLRQNKPPKLNVKWEKDRGKDVESAPWFHLFKGERINNHHTTLEEKRRERQQSQERITMESTEKIR